MTTEPLGAPQPPDSPEPHERHRRIAPLPVALAVGGIVLAGAFAVVVAGLAGTAPSAVPSASPSASIPAPPPAAVAPAPSETPRPAAGPNECVDARADGSGVDLDSVALSAEGDALRVVFVLTEPLPDGDASLELFADGGDVRYQLATVWSDGELDEFFAYRLPTESEDGDDRGGEQGSDDRGPGDRDAPSRDGDDGQRSDLKKRDVVNEGTVIVATFPGKVLDRLGDSFLWYASATADHDPADSCYLEDGSLVPFSR